MNAPLDARAAARLLGGDVVKGRILCPGPGHSAKDRSLSVMLDPAAPGGFLVHSFAGDDPIAARDYVRDKLGLPPWEPNVNGKPRQPNGAARPHKPRTGAEYVYKLADGTPYLKVLRTEPKAGFPQMHWTGASWAWGKPSGPKVPYRLPELLEAVGDEVFVCEGEKDADNLAALGFVATTASEGAGKWTADLNPWFKGRVVFILADNDRPGRNHACQVAQNLYGIAAEVRIVELPGLPEKGDVSDWLAAGNDPGELVNLCRSFPVYAPEDTAKAKAEPSTKPNGHAKPDETLDDADAEIRQLAALGTPAYERERKAAAKRLGMRTSTLDRLVEAERGKGAVARGLTLPEVDPWPEPVDGADVLNDIMVAIRDHLVVGQSAAEAMALWAVHTHAHDAALISPRLAFTSPAKRCGKTTALQIVQAVVPRPMPAANITAAALFRAVEAVKPTMLVDEADTFLKNSDELRGVLNSGHNRASAFVVRTVGEDHTPTQFRTWAPVAVAMIGELPGTLADRSIIVEMQRKKASDVVRRFRSDRTEAFAVLARKAARFAEDAFDELREWDGEVPERLHDRAADNWRPLLAIAEAAGGDWPRRARAAALALSGVEEDDDAEAGVQLLADMRDIFAGLDNPKAVSTVTMLSRLNAMETRPWPEWKHGKPMTDLQLAKLLKPFKIKPKVVRDGDGQFRGYAKEALKDVFARYTPL